MLLLRVTGLIVKGTSLSWQHNNYLYDVNLQGAGEVANYSAKYFSITMHPARVLSHEGHTQTTHANI